MKTHKWTEIEAKMSPEVKARSEERYRQMVAEMPLEELRAARQMTQVQMAKLIGFEDREAHRHVCQHARKFY